MTRLCLMAEALSTPEKNGSKIGLFRIFCAVFGGLLGAYSGMTLLVFLIPSTIDRALIIPYLFTLLAWPCTALWICVSPTKSEALLRSLVPSAVFTLGILYFILRT